MTYVPLSRMQCPKCSCTDIDGEEVNIGDTTAEQDCCCNECGATFRAIFKIEGAHIED